MRALLAITKNTILETVRDKILLLILAFGVVLILATVLLADISARQDSKIILDIGIGLSDLFGTLVTIFVGTHLIFREIDHKTILLILSKPIGRGSFLLGKFLGLAAVLLLMQIGMTTFFLATVAYNTDLLYSGGVLKMFFLLDVLQIAVFSLLSFWLLLAVVIFFASFLRPTLAAFSALAVFVVGHLTDDVKVFADFSRNAADSFHWVADAMYYGLPNFAILNLKNYILEGVQFSAAQMATIAGGTVLWIAALLLLATTFFRSREF